MKSQFIARNHMLIIRASFDSCDVLQPQHFLRTLPHKTPFTICHTRGHQFDQARARWLLLPRLHLIQTGPICQLSAVLFMSRWASVRRSVRLFCLCFCLLPHIVLIFMTRARAFEEKARTWIYTIFMRTRRRPGKTLPWSFTHSHSPERFVRHLHAFKCTINVTSIARSVHDRIFANMWSS